MFEKEINKIINKIIIILIIRHKFNRLYNYKANMIYIFKGFKYIFGIN